MSTARRVGLVAAPVHEGARNPVRPFDPAPVAACRVDRSAVERRVATLTARRSIKGDWQAAWLLKAVSCIDLTTLAGDDTPGRVRRLCAKARRPVRADILEGLGIDPDRVRVGAVCVYPAMVEHAVKALEGCGIPVASVATAFPAGLSSMAVRLADIRHAVASGAAEIDVVISRGLALTGAWSALHDEIAAFREACGHAHMKVILGTGDLSTLTNVARASVVAMQAGADVIKTSTGKEDVNATLPVGLVMVRAIRDHLDAAGHKVGFKPAGGIRTAREAIDWLVLMREELGRDWLEPSLFRFGASTLLTDIERQLEHHVTGHYSAAHRHPAA